MPRWLKPKIVLKTEQDLALMRPACVIAQTVLDEVCEFIQPGITSRQVDEYAAGRMRHYGVKSAFLGYKKFPRYLCISVNEQVVQRVGQRAATGVWRHCQPGRGRGLPGFIGDTARTVAVGAVAAWKRSG